MEMYGADSTRYSGPCYCDACWGRFVAEHLEGVDPADVPLADRPAWIAGNGLARDYARWQELEVTAILRGIQERVHAANPDFLLGNLLDSSDVVHGTYVELSGGRPRLFVFGKGEITERVDILNAPDDDRSVENNLP